MISSSKRKTETVSFKRKMEILGALNSPTLSYEDAAVYLEYAAVPGLSKVVLDAIFSRLVLLDTEVSASHDLISEEAWEELTATPVCSTPPPSQQNSPLRDQIESLSDGFLAVSRALIESELKMEELLDIMSPVFKNKTKNVQFILFKFAKVHPRHVFGYLIFRVRQNPRLYAPFFSSLLVRLRMEDREVQMRCIKAYLNFIRTYKLTRAVDSVVLSQSLLYILCFEPSYMSTVSGMKEAVDRIFELGIPRNMNGDVLDRFCEIFNDYSATADSRPKSEWTEYFPFDLPICPRIKDDVASDYNEFKPAAAEGPVDDGQIGLVVHGE